MLRAGREFTTQTYKPDNYNTVSPYLIVDGANRTIEFIKTVFGGVELRRFADTNGKSYMLRFELTIQL